MQLTERQYERIAQWLDGQELELSPAEQAAAQEILDGEAFLAPHWGLQAPPHALQKARRRMLCDIARPGRLTIWLRRAAGIAAAALLVGITTWALRDVYTRGPSRANPPMTESPAQVPIEVVLTEMENAADLGPTELVLARVRDLEADMRSSQAYQEPEMNYDVVSGEPEDLSSQ